MMSDLALFDPTQLFLELDETTINKAWLQSQAAHTPASRWQTYLNRLCLDVLLSWLKEEQSEPVKVNPHHATYWELINGTAITLGNAKLLFVPSEASDLSEMRVPQEWVDIPDLVADYYLAVQVNVDDCYIRFWGYSTHQQLKTNGNYNSSDRSYALDEDLLITDIDALWTARELCLDEGTQVAVEPISAISATQANNLIQRLSDAEILLPRLAIPFTFWASLIQDETCLKRLVQKRRGLPDRGSVLQWLQTGVTNLAEEFGWRQIEFKPSVVGARGTATATPTNDAAVTPKVALAKQITIADNPYEFKILPLNSQEGIWGFELRSLILGGTIPAGFKLKLLTEDLESFEGNEDIATNNVEQLYLEVALESGEGLVWVVEPTPEEYQPEILRF